MIRRSPTHELIRRLCTGAVCLGSGTLPTAANLVINPIYVDAEGESWDATRQAIVDQAISDWTNVLGAPGGQTYEFDITFSFDRAGTGGRLARWNGSGSNLFVGDDLLPWNKATHVVNFNADVLDTSLSNYLWWDPSPGDGSDQPFVAWDALSVARHEIGHALGYTNDFYTYDFGAPSQSKPWGDLISDVGGTPVFDAGGLNIGMNSFSDISHVANSGLSQDDLMTPAIVNGTRREISQINIDMLTTAYGYEVIPEPSAIILVASSGLLLLRRKR